MGEQHLEKSRGPPKPGKVDLTLPPAPEGSTNNDAYYRQAVQTLINTHGVHANCLKKIHEMYKKYPAFASRINSSLEAKKAFEKVGEILEIFEMFSRALTEALQNFYNGGSIANCLTKFCGDMAFSAYSDYINNYKAAEAICKSILDKRRSNHPSRKIWKRMLPELLSMDLIKPAQRYPQLIMIIKDLQEHIPRDHPDRLRLQEVLTDVEYTTFRLNESKRLVDQRREGIKVAQTLLPHCSCSANPRLVRDACMDQMLQIVDVRVLKPRRLCLMADKLVVVDMCDRSHSQTHLDPVYCKDLARLELTPARSTLERFANWYCDGTLGTGPDNSCEDIKRVVSEINKRRHDIALLEDARKKLSDLIWPNRIISHIDNELAELQMAEQNFHCQLLQLLDSIYIFILDGERELAFCAPNIGCKQGWCADFTIAKLALEENNLPCWFGQDLQEGAVRNPAMLLTHVSMRAHSEHRQSILRLNMKCAVRVKLPYGQAGLMEHLWVCASNASSGHVFLVPLHRDGDTSIEPFPVTSSNITCVERVPHTNDAGEQADSIWLGTSDSEILVFMFSAGKPDAHRTPSHVLTPDCSVVTMKAIDGRVFCGSIMGHVFIYSFDGSNNSWLCSAQIPTGLQEPVTSIVCNADSIWIGCGSKIILVDRKSTETQGEIGVGEDQGLQVNCMVRAGVGVWVSFRDRPEMKLYHIESRKCCQDISIAMSVWDFPADHQYFRGTKIAVECLNVSMGLLWVGTNVGLLLSYPIPRLSRCVPKIKQRPLIGRYGHGRPIRFLVPLIYDPVSGLSIREQGSPDEIGGEDLTTSTDSVDEDGDPPEADIIHDNDEPDLQNKKDGTDVTLRHRPGSISKLAAYKLTSGVTGEQENGLKTVQKRNTQQSLSNVSITNNSMHQLYPSLFMEPNTQAHFSNTILLVSGGNGFMDWYSQGREEDDMDPRLIFWIYKV